MTDEPRCICIPDGHDLIPNEACPFHGEDGTMVVDGPRGSRRPEPSKELSNYVDKSMYEAEPIKNQVPQVYLLSATPDPLGSIAAMSMMYEGKVVRDLADVTDEQRRHYFSESFKTHLKAPWEAVDFHFMIEGVTRAFTHQMVRQRTAVFAQESMRFAVKEEIAARPGPIIGDHKPSRNTWEAAIQEIWEAYWSLIANGVPAEEARGLLPHDTLTRLHYKTNLRNLAEHLGNRLCTQAQFEWRVVASQLLVAIRSYNPVTTGGTPVRSYFPEGLDGIEYIRARDLKSYGWQFREIAESPIFQPICFTTGKCEFRSAADRGCTIRDRVDEGAFHEIEPAEWLADPTAGWVR